MLIISRSRRTLLRSSDKKLKRLFCVIYLHISFSTTDKMFINKRSGSFIMNLLLRNLTISYDHIWRTHTMKNCIHSNSIQVRHHITNGDKVSAFSQFNHVVLKLTILTSANGRIDFIFPIRLSSMSFLQQPCNPGHNS